MNRLVLRNLLRRIVMASLPLAAACEHDALPGAGGDLAPPVVSDMAQDLACVPPVVTDMAIYGRSPDDFGFGGGGMCWQLVDGTFTVGSTVQCQNLCTCTLV